MSEMQEPTLTEQDEERQAQGLPPVGWEPPENWISPEDIPTEGIPLPSDSGLSSNGSDDGE